MATTRHQSIGSYSVQSWKSILQILCRPAELNERATGLIQKWRVHPDMAESGRVEAWDRIAISVQYKSPLFVEHVARTWRVLRPRSEWPA